MQVRAVAQAGTVPSVAWSARRASGSTTDTVLMVSAREPTGLGRAELHGQQGLSLDDAQSQLAGIGYDSAQGAWTEPRVLLEERGGQ